MCRVCLAEYTVTELRRLLGADKSTRLLSVLKFCHAGIISEEWANYELDGITRDDPAARKLIKNYFVVAATEKGPDQSCGRKRPRPSY